MTTNRKFGWHSGAVHCKSIKIGGGTIVSGETHISDYAATGYLGGAGKSVVAQNIVLTTTGTAGMWASAIYAKVVEGTTKNVNGYISAAEFEVAVAGTYAPSSIQILSLNSTVTNGSMKSGSGMAYIGLHDYGTDAGAALGATSMNALLRFGEQTIGADADGASLLAANTLASSTHTIRFLIGDVAYYIMCANVTHN